MAGKIYTVSQLNKYLRQQFDDDIILQNIMLKGEISNFKVHSSGHCYFTLKDNLASIKCVAFRFNAMKFRFAPQNGMKVIASGYISIYEKDGLYQLYVQSLAPEGIGELALAFEQLKNKLNDEGLFDSKYKKQLPFYPKRIGVVTSRMGAVIKDICHVAKRRNPLVKILLYSVLVQGENASKEIVQGIEFFNKKCPVDVIIIGRGGGSLEDLWAFNEEPVVRAIEACTIPIVSGVGHETDFTLADFAADMRAPTPTAAAELVSPNRAELLRKLALAQTQLRGTLQQRYYDASQRLDWLTRQLRHPQQKLDEQKTHLAALQQNLRFAMQNQHRFSAQKLVQQQQKLAHLRPDTAAVGRDLAAFQTALQQNWQTLFNLRRQGLEKQAALLEAVSPQHILARGFSVVKNSRGQVIRNADSLKQGQKLHIVFAEGETDVRVTREHKQPDLFDYS